MVAQRILSYLCLHNAYSHSHILAHQCRYALRVLESQWKKSSTPGRLKSQSSVPLKLWRGMTGHWIFVIWCFTTLCNISCFSSLAAYTLILSVSPSCSFETQLGLIALSWPKNGSHTHFTEMTIGWNCKKYSSMTISQKHFLNLA